MSLARFTELLTLRTCLFLSDGIATSLAVVCASLGSALSLNSLQDALAPVNRSERGCHCAVRLEGAGDSKEGVDADADSSWVATISRLTTIRRKGSRREKPPKLLERAMNAESQIEWLFVGLALRS